MKRGGCASQNSMMQEITRQETSLEEGSEANQHRVGLTSNQDGCEPSVSDRLAALKMKLKQSHHGEAEGYGGEEKRSNSDDGKNRDLNAQHVDASILTELRRQLEKEVSKNSHLVALYEEQREELENMQAEHDRVQQEAREQVDTMNKKYAAMAHDLESQIEENRSMKEQGPGNVTELQERVKELQDQLDQLESEKHHGTASRLEDLEQALTKSNTELKFAKDQLHRLKSQMISTQDEEENQIRWRVEAEVALRLEQLGISPDGKVPVRDAQLLEDLEIALHKVQESEKEVCHLKEVLERREMEMKNMEIALGELRYESEAAENLRIQVRSLEAKMQSKNDEVEEAKAKCTEYERQANAALEQLAQEKKKAAAARDAEGAARQEMISLQVAYNDLALKMKGSDNHKTYDRSLIVKMLKDMASLRHSQAIKKAVQTLSLTQEERIYVLGDNTSSLASNWVTFLESQVEDDEM